MPRESTPKQKHWQCNEILTHAGQYLIAQRKDWRHGAYYKKDLRDACEILKWLTQPWWVTDTIEQWPKVKKRTSERPAADIRYAYALARARGWTARSIRCALSDATMEIEPIKMRPEEMKAYEQAMREKTASTGN